MIIRYYDRNVVSWTTRQLRSKKWKLVLFDMNSLPYDFAPLAIIVKTHT